jgi:5-methylcytosine-specific restriction endonuclease McrBC regulatory subunit McrC
MLNLKPLERGLGDFLETEFTGIDQNGIYRPKSAKDLSGTDLSFTLKGICRAWSKANTSRGIYLTKPVQLDVSENKEFFEFLLFFWLQRFNNLMANHLLPVFKPFRESLPFAVGRVDLVALEAKMERSTFQFDCDFSNVSSDVDVLRILKDGYIEVLRRASSMTATEGEILALVGRGLQILKNVPSSKNPVSNALKVRWKIRDVGMAGSHLARLAPLIEAVTFFSNYIPSTQEGLLAKKGNVQGVLFNMNYLLEYVVRRAIRTLYSDLEPQKKEFANGQINRIVVRNGDRKKSKHMNPDCVGIFSRVNTDLPAKVINFINDKVYIFDAKHKTIGDSRSTQAGFGRDDFYQLVAYSSTHSNSGKREGIYGLIGIESESSFLNDKNWALRRYVTGGREKTTAILNISFDQRNLDLVQIPIRFGQFLYDLGRIEEDQSDLLYKALGISIIEEACELLTG